MKFPPNFVWGAATASYQIEGSAGGRRGECIWDRFSHTPGNVTNGDTGDVACDHLHRYREDIAIMRDLGLDAYRYSISWPRIIPDGTGRLNQEGLDFYKSLTDALLEAGITPYVTLYHWDLPQALQARGGWESPDSVRWFADYAAVVVEHLGDRVQHWITHNEPWCTAFLGNLLGIHAPGKRDAAAAFRVAHHLLISHGAAAQAIRARQADSTVGIAINMNGITPASADPRDADAARNMDGFANRWFLDPLFRGTYPADMLPYFTGALDGIDLDAVRAAAVPLDFLGLNYYTRDNYAWDENHPIKAATVKTPGAPRTAMDWEVHPPSLTDILVRLNRDYDVPPIMITENGAAFDDPAPVDGTVDDPERVAYLRGHLAAVADAIALGVPVQGYFVWSLLDNFEWAEGYSKRFGIVRVDFDTLERTPKESARYYRDVIAAQRTP